MKFTTINIESKEATLKKNRTAAYVPTKQLALVPHLLDDKQNSCFTFEP